MSDFTYAPPDSPTFMNTLRVYLQATGNGSVAALLMNGSYNISSSGSYSGQRWNAYSASLTIYVSATNLAQLTGEMQKVVFEAVDRVFPKEVGYDFYEINFSMLLEMPPDDEKLIANSASLTSSGTIQHDGLQFRSKTETRIYDALKKRNVLFFANATAVLGGKDIKREPDFLVCLNGKWGILEVMGEQYHPSATAMRDHDRARLFKDYGLYYIEFYDASRCYNHPDEVVNDFLDRLSRVQ